MRTRTLSTFIVCFCIFAVSLGGTEKATLTQISTINALLNSVFDGETTIGELKEHGDTGIGTFNGLDGEMIALDGIFYKIKSDGTIEAQEDSAKTPFASVTFFKEDISFPLPAGTELKDFCVNTDEKLPTLNIFYVIIIEGTFQSVKTRSVPKHEKPYKGILEIVKDQPVFNFINVKGTMTGFRCPPYVKGINVPGYHLHFLTSDKKGGGHILNFKTDSVKIRIGKIFNFNMRLPDSKEFFETDLVKKKDKELKQVEADTK